MTRISVVALMTASLIAGCEPAPSDNAGKSTAIGDKTAVSDEKALNPRSPVSEQQELQDEFAMALAAKRLCSGLFVSSRERANIMNNSVVTFLDDRARTALSAGELNYDVDPDTQVVSANWSTRQARARFFGDQGCVILRDGSTDVMFNPVTVESTLPPAAETPWPMGDVEPYTPMPSFDREKRDQALEAAFSEPDDHTAAFIAVYQGRIIAERYGDGAHRDMQLESWSMGKSVTSTLIGVLIQQGHLELDEPAPVPAWQNVPDDPRAAIRIRDLLQMSSGLLCTHSSEDAGRLQASFIPGAPDHSLGYTTAIDVFQLAQSRELEHPPGTVGRYRNCDPLTLGAIIKRKVEAEGNSYLRWPQQALFDRIGVRRQVLETDIYGNFVMTGFDYGTARNWARLGMLYLNDGVFGDERILPPGYAEFAGTKAPGWGNGEYGGLFWVGHEALPAGTYSMRGAGGQEVAIVPAHDLVLVRLGHTRGAAGDYQVRRNRAYRLIVEAIDTGQNADE